MRKCKANVNRAWKVYKMNVNNDDRESDASLLQGYHDQRKCFKKLIVEKKLMYYDEVRKKKNSKCQIEG